MLLNASGCLDALAAPDVAHSLDAYVTKTVTPSPRIGNDPVRIAETDVGMLNSIGLANPGIDGLLREQLPRLAELAIPIWVSVAGSSAHEYATLCGRLDARAEVSVIELNVSCPNVESASDTVASIVTAARAATTKPLYVKLAPEGDVASVAVAAERAGADGLTLVNTLRGLALDERTLRPRLATAIGGLSGPALKPVALAAVYECFRATKLPIVGVGGVMTGRDALEFLAAGANAVGLGTVLFADPAAPGRIRRELGAATEAVAVSYPGNAIGAAHAAPRRRSSTLDQRSRVAA